MKTLNILATILFSLFSLNFCDDADLSLNDVAVKVLGQSGKIQIAKNYTNGNETTLETVTINFSALRERDANGADVGTTGKVKHSFNNFATFNFVVEPVQVGKFQNLTVLSTTLTASNIVNDTQGTFVAKVLVFNETGVIETGINETAKVNAGALKFTVDVNDWPFCDGTVEDQESLAFCQKGQDRETGAFLDFELEIKGQLQANKSLNSNSTYQLGNSDFVLSNYVKLDGDDYTQLPENYPAYERQGEKDVFTFRFPLFKTSASYDPLVVMNSVEEKSSNTWLVIGIVVGIVAIGVVIFFVLKCFNSGRKSETLMP